MINQQRIAHGLARLGGKPDSPDTGHQLGTLQLVLRRIDETILPRQIRFVRDGGQTCLSLIVGNRRLLRVADLSDTQLAALNSGLENGDAEGNPGLQRHLRELILSKLTPAQGISTRSEPLESEDAMSSLGVASNYLSEVWGIPVYGPLPEEDSDHLARLEAWADASGFALWDGTAGDRPDPLLPDSPLLLFEALSGQLTQGLATVSLSADQRELVLARQSDRYLAFTMPSGHLSELHSVWYASR